MRATSGARGGPSRETMRLNPLGLSVVRPTLVRRPPTPRTAGRRPSRGAPTTKAWSTLPARRASRRQICAASPKCHHRSRTRLCLPPEASLVQRGLGPTTKKAQHRRRGFASSQILATITLPLATRDAKPATRLNAEPRRHSFRCRSSAPHRARRRKQGAARAPEHSAQPKRPWPPSRSTGPRI